MVILDEQLVKQYLKGDEKALESLVKRYLKSAFNISYQYMKNTESAEDLTQDIFLKLWKKLKKFDTNKKFKPWFFILAKNCCLDYLKKKKEISFSDIKTEDEENNLLENIPDNSLLPNKLFEENEENRYLKKNINKITKKYRKVVSLYGEGYSLSEIAKIIGKPINTIKSLQRRALIQLRKLFSNSP